MITAVSNGSHVSLTEMMFLLFPINLWCLGDCLNKGNCIVKNMMLSDGFVLF